MLKDVVDSISEWSWFTRIIIASILIAVSAALHIYFERIWIWGYAIAGFIILSGLLFTEKHVEYKDDEAEELIVNHLYLDWGALVELMSFFTEIAIKGFSVEKYNSLIQQLEIMAEGSQKQFNYFITTEHTASSLSILIQKDQGHYRVMITANEEISHIVSRFSTAE